MLNSKKKFMCYEPMIDGFKFSKIWETKDEYIYLRCTDHNRKPSVVICK